MAEVEVSEEVSYVIHKVYGDIQKFPPIGPILIGALLGLLRSTSSGDELRNMDAVLETIREIEANFLRTGLLHDTALAATGFPQLVKGDREIIRREFISYLKKNVEEVDLSWLD